MKKIGLLLLSSVMALCLCLGLAACNAGVKGDNLYITLDTTAVTKVFDIGDEFNCDGLIVTAHYGDESKVVEDYSVKTPDMTTAGAKDVVVNYNGAKSQYTVTVRKDVTVGQEVVELGAPVVKYVYDSNAVTVDGATTLVGGDLVFTAEPVDGYSIASVTVKVDGDEVPVWGGVNSFTVPSEALTGNAVVTIAAETEGKYTVNYYSENGTLLASYGADTVEGLELYNPEETYYDFNGWYNGGVKVTALGDVLSEDVTSVDLYGQWTLNETAVADVQNHIAIYVTTMLETVNEANVSVEIAINDDNEWWIGLLGELTEHGDKISGLGIVLTNAASVEYTISKDDVGTLEAPKGVSGSFNGGKSDEIYLNDNARLYAYGWANYYGSLTAYFKINSDYLSARYFTPWIMIESAAADTVYKPSAGAYIDQTPENQVEGETKLGTVLPKNASLEWDLARSSNSETINYKQQLHDSALWDGLDINIYDASNNDAQNYDFSNDTPFASYHADKKAVIRYDSLNSAILNAWNQLGSPKQEYTFVFAIQLTANARAKKLGYTDYSDLYYASETSGVRDTVTIDFAKKLQMSDSILQVNESGTIGYTIVQVYTDSSKVDPWLEQFNGYVDGLTSSNVKDYFQVQIDLNYTAITANGTYTGPTYTEYTTFQREWDFDRTANDGSKYGLKWNWLNIYFDIAESGTATANVKDGTLIAKNDVNGECTTVAIDKVTYTVSVSVVLKETVGDTGEANPLLKYFEPATASKSYLPGTQEFIDVNQAPSDAQVGFTGNVTFVRTLDGKSQAGVVFTTYNIDKVLIKISNDEDNEGATVYYLALCYEDGILTIYKADKDGNIITTYDDGTSINDGKSLIDNNNFNNVKNSYCTPALFNTAVQTAYKGEDGIDSFGIFAQKADKTSVWKISTKIIVGEDTVTWTSNGNWSDWVAKY